MYAIEFFHGMVFYAPIATLYRQAHSVSVFQITLIESISMALCVLLEMPWGIVADKIGYRRTMVICCGLDLVSKLIFWQADSFSDFLFERIILSIVITGVSGVDSAIVYLSCEKGKSQHTFGILNSMSSLGLIVSSTLFSLLIKENYKTAALFTVFSYGTAFMLSFFLSEVRQNRSLAPVFFNLKPTVLAIFKDKKLLPFLLAVGLFEQTHQTVTVFLSQLRYERAGMNSAAIGTVYTIMTVLAIIGTFSARVTKRTGECKAFMLFCIPGAVCCALLAAVDSAVLSVMSILVLRVSHSFFAPLQAEIQNRFVKTNNRATELSVNAMFTDCVGIVVNLIFGALSKSSLSITFLFGAIICTFSCHILFRITKSGRQNKARVV